MERARKRALPPSRSFFSSRGYGALEAYTRASGEEELGSVTPLTLEPAIQREKKGLHAQEKRERESIAATVRQPADCGPSLCSAA